MDQELRASIEAVLAVWRGAPRGVSFGRFMEKALGDLSDAFGKASSAKVSE